VVGTCRPHDRLLWNSASRGLDSRFNRKLIQAGSRVSWPLGNGPPGFYADFHIWFAMHFNSGLFVGCNADFILILLARITGIRKNGYGWKA
jgi:hypothetical protein